MTAIEHGGSCALRFTPSANAAGETGSENSPDSSTAQVSAPAAGVTVLESGEFSLPPSSAAFALGVNLSAQLPPCSIAVTCQLFAYNV